MLRDVSAGRLDLAVVFCAPAALPDGVELELLREEPAVVQPPAGHRLAGRGALTLHDLAGETVLIAGGGESGGFSDRVLGAFAAAGSSRGPRRTPTRTSACAPFARASGS